MNRFTVILLSFIFFSCAPRDVRLSSLSHLQESATDAPKGQATPQHSLLITQGYLPLCQGPISQEIVLPESVIDDIQMHQRKDFAVSPVPCINISRPLKLISQNETGRDPIIIQIEAAVFANWDLLFQEPHLQKFRSTTALQSELLAHYGPKVTEQALAIFTISEP